MPQQKRIFCPDEGCAHLKGFLDNRTLQIHSAAVHHPLSLPCTLLRPDGDVCLKKFSALAEPNILKSLLAIHYRWTHKPKPCGTSRVPAEKSDSQNDGKEAAPPPHISPPLAPSQEALGTPYEVTKRKHSETESSVDGQNAGKKRLHPFFVKTAMNSDTEGKAAAIVENKAVLARQNTTAIKKAIVRTKAAKLKAAAKAKPLHPAFSQFFRGSTTNTPKSDDRQKEQDSERDDADVAQTGIEELPRKQEGTIAQQGQKVFTENEAAIVLSTLANKGLKKPGAPRILPFQGTFDEGLELKRCLDVLGKTLESVVDNYLYDVEVSLELAQPLETFPEHLTTFVRNYNLAFTGYYKDYKIELARRIVTDEVGRRHRVSGQKFCTGPGIDIECFYKTIVSAETTRYKVKQSSGVRPKIRTMTRCVVCDTAGTRRPSPELRKRKLERNPRSCLFNLFCLHLRPEGSGAKFCEVHVLQVAESGAAERRSGHLSQASRFANSAAIGPCRYLETSAELLSYLEPLRGTMYLSQDLRPLRCERNVFYVDTEFIHDTLIELAVLDFEGKVVLDCIVEYSKMSWQETATHFLPLSDRHTLRRFGFDARGNPPSRPEMLSGREIAMHLSAAGVRKDSHWIEYSSSGCDYKKIKNYLEAEGFENILPEEDRVLTPLFEWRKALKGFWDCSLENIANFILPNHPTTMVEHHRAKGDTDKLYHTTRWLFDYMKQ